MTSGHVSNIKINGKPLELYSLTGIVADTDTRSETEVHGSGGGGLPNTHPGSAQSSPVHFKIESSTTRYQNIYVIDENEQEHHIHLIDFLVSCRKGSLLSLIWGIKKGKKQGPYLAAYNHNTQEVSYDDDILGQFCRPKLLALILYPVMILLCIFVCLIVAGLIPVGENVAMVMKPFFYLLGTLVGIKAGWHISKAIMDAIMNKKIRRFKASKSWLTVLELFQSIPKDKFNALEVT